MRNSPILAALAAGVAFGTGVGGNVEVIRHGTNDLGPSPFSYNDSPRIRRVHMGNNRPHATFAAKRHRRKIARASRRYNLRTGA